jgi:REP element-mobilizing transposase RayT
MSHTYAQNVIHVVFSTKDRRKVISAEFQPKMWAYAAGICKTSEFLFTPWVGRRTTFIS